MSSRADTSKKSKEQRGSRKGRGIVSFWQAGMLEISSAISTNWVVRVKSALFSVISCFMLCLFCFWIGRNVAVYIWERLGANILI